MQDRIRLPIINDNATKEDIRAMAEELLALDSDIDLREDLTEQPTDDHTRVAG